MTTMRAHETAVISTFYSADYSLMAMVICGQSCYFVDFYKDDAIIDSKRIEDKSLRYVEDMAENFVDGIIKIDTLLGG